MGTIISYSPSGKLCVCCRNTDYPERVIFGGETLKCDRCGHDCSNPECARLPKNHGGFWGRFRRIKSRFV